MLSGPELHWGTALRWQHPLLSLLAAPRPGQLISRLAHPVAVTALAVWTAPDSQQPPLVLRQAMCKRLLFQVHLLTPIAHKHPYDVISIRNLPPCSADANGLLKLWAVGEATASTAVRRVAAHLLHSGAINCLETHPPSGLLASAGDDGAVRLWQLSDLLKGQPPTPRGCLAGHGSAVSTTAFSTCGAFLASCSLSDGTVRLWSVADREQLAALRLAASSVTFAPGDAAALLVSGPSLPPQLVDLRRVPACQQHCRCLEAKGGQQDGSSGGGSRSMAVCSTASAALHPAAAMWLPGSPQPSLADLPVQTPGQHPALTGPAGADAGPSNPRSCRPGGLGSPRHAGSLVEFSRKRRRNGDRHQQRGAGQVSLEGAPPAAATPRCSMRAASPCSWLPGSDSPWSPRAAARSGHIARRDGSSGVGVLAGLLAMPPASPAASPDAADSKDDCAVPNSAVLARWHAPPADASGEWDTRQQRFVYRQVRGHGRLSPLTAA